nr:pheromone alpha sk2,mating [Lachancea kluyveri]prf//1206200A mating pheromone alpha sk1 [Lachancea kluyveri]
WHWLSFSKGEPMY